MEMKMKNKVQEKKEEINNNNEKAKHKKATTTKNKNSFLVGSLILDPLVKWMDFGGLELRF